MSHVASDARPFVGRGFTIGAKTGNMQHDIRSRNDSLSWIRNHKAEALGRIKPFDLARDPHNRFWVFRVSDIRP